MADGIYYVDTRQPFQIADLASITLAATQKCCWTPGSTSPTLVPAGYFTVGKIVRLTANLKITNGTAANLTFGMCVGVGDAAAVNVSTTARALVASVGPFSCFMQGYAQCRSVGTAGTISLWGLAVYDLAGMLSTAQPNVFPANGTTVVSTLDTTLATTGVYFQMSCSAGTTTVVATNVIMEAMN
jgi:hypothetical protein